MSSRKIKPKTLSDKIADSFTPRSLIDPENNSDDETQAKIVDIDSDDSDYVKLAKPKQLSDFRKKNIKLLSEQSDKYHGIISSRKDIQEEDEYESSDSLEDEENSPSSTSGNLLEHNKEEADDSSEDDDDGDDLEKYRKKLINCQIKDEDKDESFSTDDDDFENDKYDNEENSNTDSNKDDSDYGSSGEEIGEEKDEQGTLAEQNLLTESNQMTEIQKGLAVQNQLKLWEKLLEVRIHSQKILIKANSLPLPNQHDKLKENDEFVQATKTTTENVQILLDNMLEMQTILTKQYSETKDLIKTAGNNKKRQSTSLLDDIDAPPNKRFGKILDENFNNFRPYRNSVLQKWHDRTKILTPGAGAKAQSENYDIIRKIETVLLNKNDLIKKSQILKGNYNLFGEKPKNDIEEDENNEISVDNEEQNTKSCPNIYDDTDFYHQQLRELIEYKTNTSANPTELTKQFAELQKLRQKMKKKVDTRASKGRKIRYVVHNKLVNFMAPNDNSDWTDESKSELFRSLFTE